MSILMRFNCGCIGIPLSGTTREHRTCDALIFKVCDGDDEESPLGLFLRGHISLKGVSNDPPRYQRIKHIPPSPITDAEEREIFSGINRMIVAGHWGNKRDYPLKNAYCPKCGNALSRTTHECKARKSALFPVYKKEEA